MSRLIILHTAEEFYSQLGRLLPTSLRFIGNAANLTIVIYEETKYG